MNVDKDKSRFHGQDAGKYKLNRQQGRRDAHSQLNVELLDLLVLQ